MPIEQPINAITEEIAIAEIIESNHSAMENRAQYPVHEREFLLTCCDFVERECPSNCLCHEFAGVGDNSEMCWIIKRDCGLEDFKRSFARLWIGANFQARFLRNEGHPRINRALDLFNNIIPEIWGDICEIGNNNRRCIICSQPLINEAIELRMIFDTYRIYDSKLLSQIFYDSLIPHDTKSAAAMRAVGYMPAQNGLDMSGHIRVFLQQHNMNIAALRGLDNAPLDCWQNPIIGEVAPPNQALSRIIDKLFYVP